MTAYGATNVAIPVDVQVQHSLTIRDRRTELSWFGNLLWVLLGGGLPIAVIYMAAGIVLCATLIFAPFGIQLLKMSNFALLPFGKSAKPSEAPLSVSLFQLLASIIWFPFGLVLVILHAVFACVSFCSIVGIPFGVQHVKLAQFAMCPFGVQDDHGFDEYHEITTTYVDRPAPSSSHVPVALVAEPLIVKNT